ncbi:3-demethylubiquinone-9 3-methyltransferase [Sphingomonas sp. Root710]|uniref:bifunctional 2-polyprenyl-6-hydroxyphenol methylase/3-demethylubiquinol 3-O-methyltransferase UbiG n=1 Tax=Sphingomonas sp. Root710 TaxID=1736594 RepID=UPI000700AE92|nr:bifunctional 2-polyprenyl-6-hydroxyphenol methylase/3-demethylubiquinol 3-O-methyltransferase UbiG [Sphingomonas sp. Root710]KRB86249.1 3-demethylubiquinone-9 3-methyltransferase [Sphingomonas sp. Root710]
MNASAQEYSSIVAEEAAHFGKLAADWWDPNGSSAMLHKLNPPRLRHIRATVDQHWGGDSAAVKSLAGKRAVDVGCGAGLLAEPLARMGAAVTAIDAAPENVAVARLHAEKQGLNIDYRAGGVEALQGERFDLVTSMEVIEHVADPAAFIAGLAELLAPGGVMILSTPNRTPLSHLAMIRIGEGLGMVPKGTHDWHKFLTPDELSAHLGAAGLRVTDRKGLSFSPAAGFHLSDNLALDYFLTAVR